MTEDTLVDRNLTGLCEALPENMREVCKDQKTLMFNRLIYYAEQCNFEDLAQTFRESGEENRAYSDILGQLRKQKVVSSEQYEAILDKIVDYDAAVTQAVRETLSEACHCRL